MRKLRGCSLSLILMAQEL